ncbi:MAG: NAD-dependent DNA ligase LigA [Pirellulaceae bacterium]
MPHNTATNANEESREADDLERVIAHLDTLYERGEVCTHPDTEVEVSDGEYDGLRRRLRELRPDSKIFDTATASKVDSPAAKVVHDPPLTSIEKASHEDIATQEEMLFKWMDSCLQDAAPEQLDRTLQNKSYRDEAVRYPSEYFYQAYKLDGVALALYYEKGKLARAGLRPRDGINGEDVTEQAKHVEGVPAKLGKPVTCSIRGELICRLSDFEAVQQSLEDAGEKLRANPRNHAAGGIRQFKDPSKTKLMRLSFVAYAIEALADPPYRTELQRAEYCETQLGVPYISTRFFDFAELEAMEKAIPELDFEVDGVIVGVNNLEDQEQLGRHGDPRTGNPKGKIAWKFREEEATPTIKEIEWQTGRTGKIVAVAIFEPVQLAGTNVSRATLHNAGFMSRKRIGVGTQIAVRKAGKIIPKVTGIIGGEVEPDFPEQCPSCEEPTTLQSGGSEEMLELMCTNGACAAQNIQSLVYFLETIGVLGLGESRVGTLTSSGKVKSAADFFRLNIEDGVEAGLSERQSALAVAAIHLVPSPEKLDGEELVGAIEAARQTKKQISMWQFFASFGIESASKAAGKALESHFRSLATLRSASVEALEEVDDVGEKTAVAINNYLDAHTDEIDDLLNFIEPVLPSEGKLTGKTFCFSGGFSDGKRHWEQQVEALGGKCTSGVSKKTDFLVAGTGSGSKSEKASKLDIPILNIEQLQELL